MKDLAKFSDEYRSYINAFTNNLYKYNSSNILPSKVGYCLGNDNGINSKGNKRGRVEEVIITNYVNNRDINNMNLENNEN